MLGNERTIELLFLVLRGEITKFYPSFCPLCYLSTLAIVCFATTNFYDEINNPQQRRMLKFFDRDFIAKDSGSKAEGFIYPLSNLIPFVINQLSLAG